MIVSTRLKLLSRWSNLSPKSSDVWVVTNARLTRPYGSYASLQGIFLTASSFKFSIVSYKYFGCPRIPRRWPIKCRWHSGVANSSSKLDKYWLHLQRREWRNLLKRKPATHPKYFSSPILRMSSIGSEAIRSSAMSGDIWDRKFFSEFL